MCAPHPTIVNRSARTPFLTWSRAWPTLMDEVNSEARHTVTVTVNIHEAKTHFSKLLERVRLGEEVIVAKAGQPVARLVPVQTPPKQRQPGSARGMIEIGEDFDAPLPPDIARAFCIDE